MKPLQENLVEIEDPKNCNIGIWIDVAEGEEGWMNRISFGLPNQGCCGPFWGKFPTKLEAWRDAVAKIRHRINSGLLRDDSLAGADVKMAKKLLKPFNQCVKEVEARLT